MFFLSKIEIKVSYAMKLRSAMLVSNSVGIFDIFVLTAPLLGFRYAFFFLVHVLYSKLDLCLLLALSILQSKIRNVTSSY